MSATVFNPPRADRMSAWQEKRVASLGTLFKGLGGSKDEDASEGTPCIRYGDLYTTYGDVISRIRRRVSPELASKYMPIRRGDIVFAASGESVGDIGKCGAVAVDHAVAGGDTVVLRPHQDMNPAFLAFSLNAVPHRAQISQRSSGTMIVHTSAGKLKNVQLPVPPAAEQEAIVKYLTHANARIDKAIAAKRRLIALLDESRSATIDTLVLGRDHPDRVPSTAPWLNSMPSGWEWRRCRTLTSFITSGSRGWAEYYADEGPLFLQSGNLGRQLDLKLENVQRLDLPASATEGLRTRVQPFDLLVCITGALTGNVALVPGGWGEDAYVNQHIALVRPRRGVVDAEFLGYAMKCLPSQIQFRGSEYGGTKQGLGLDEVKNLEVLMPSIDEQRAIVAAIHDRTSRIDAAVRRAEREVVLLREFRTRLIADVVTGQVDVRKIAASLPEIDPTREWDTAADLGDSAEELEDVVGDDGAA